MRVAVVGVGYVGLVSGACLAKAGHNVICMDSDTERVRLLRDGTIPYYEPGLSELVKSVVEQRRLEFTDKLSIVADAADVVIVAVGTPSQNMQSQVDLTRVEEVFQQLGQLVSSDKVFVIKSTVPVGTSERMSEVLGEELSKRDVRLNYEVVSNPEFLKEGMAIRDFTQPDRIIVGCDKDESRRVLEELYAPYVRLGHQMIFMDRRSAEMTKYAANAFLATKISFMNEIATLSEKLGVDIESVKKGMGADQRIGYEHLNPGIGYGGSCFPKDVRALRHFGEVQDQEMKVLSAVESVNRQQRQGFVEKILNCFQGDLNERKVMVWGLSFKPDTDDIREAPSLDIVRLLLKEGAHVVAYDPVASSAFAEEMGSEALDRFELAKDPYERLEGADALLLLTEWTTFKVPDFEKVHSLMRTHRIFDGRNQYDPNKLRNLGFYYYGVGRN